MSVIVENLNCSYGKNKILTDINFKIDRGDCLAILGANGVGKSTLLKCLNGVNEFSSGTINVNNNDLKKISRNELAKQVGYVCQNNNFVDMSVFDAVLLGRIPHIKWDISKKDLHITKSMIDLLELNIFEQRNVNHLSGGEKQKVAIARALAQKTNVLLLDEPTSNLDMKNQIEISKLIRKIVKEGKISLIVSIHDINLALSFANKFLLMKDGKVLAFGDKTILTKENIKKVYDIETHIYEIDNKKIILPKTI